MGSIYPCVKYASIIKGFMVCLGSGTARSNMQEVYRWNQVELGYEAYILADHAYY